jgi:hypothetical protein
MASNINENLYYCYNLDACIRIINELDTEISIELVSSLEKKNNIERLLRDLSETTSRFGVVDQIKKGFITYHSSRLFVRYFTILNNESEKKLAEEQCLQSSRYKDAFPCTHFKK